MKIPQLSHARVFAGILLLGLLAMTARNAVDPDLWWHLRTGQWILETGKIPHSDPFSFSRAGNPWVSHEWLSEVVFYKIWRHSGAAGLIVFSAVATTVGFMLLYLRCPGKPHWAGAAVALGALASAPTWGVRPQMFTFTLASLLLWLIECGEERPRLLFWIPPLFLVWLNLHAGFALGPALMLGWAVGLIWEVVAGQTRWPEARPQILRVLGLILVCMALVPLNPSGSQLYRYPLDVLRSAGMRSFIVEWLPPNFHELRYIPLLLMYLALVVAFARSPSRPKARVLLPLLAMLLASLDAARHIPIFVLLAAPLIAEFCSLASSARKAARTGQLPSARSFRVALNGTALVLMAVFAVVRWDNLVRSQAAREAELSPQKAVAFLASHNQPSRVFAYYDWGGYAIWKLYPQYRVFVDGRADLYGDDLLDQFQRAIQLKSGWRQVLDAWNVQTVLVPPTSALAQALRLDAAWRAEYRDAQAVLLSRSGPAAAGGICSGPDRRRQGGEKISTRAFANLRN